MKINERKTKFNLKSHKDTSQEVSLRQSSDWQWVSQSTKQTKHLVSQPLDCIITLLWWTVGHKELVLNEFTHGNVMPFLSKGEMTI